MKLSDFATPLKAKNNFVKASLAGFAGSGKTYTASEFIIGFYKDFKLDKPVLLIDNEKGSRFLIPKFKKAGIECLAKDTTSLEDVKKAFEFLKSGDISVLFIDSLTKIYYRFVRDYREKNRKNFMTLQDWGKILPVWQEEFSDRFVNADGNIVFTGRGGFEYEKEDDEKDADGNVTQKGSFVKSGVKMKLAGETPFEPDLNIWMDREQKITDGNIEQVRTALILKDRSTLIDGKKFVNPSYKDFKPVIKFLTGVEVGNLAGETSGNEIPSDHEYYVIATNKKIELEKIEGEFQKFGFGTTKEEKRIKALIIQNIFGTLSTTEIEKFEFNKLQERRVALGELFAELINVPIEDRMGWLENRFHIQKVA